MPISQKVTSKLLSKSTRPGVNLKNFFALTLLCKLDRFIAMPPILLIFIKWSSWQKVWVNLHQSCFMNYFLVTLVIFKYCFHETFSRKINYLKYFLKYFLRKWKEKFILYYFLETFIRTCLRKFSAFRSLPLVNFSCLAQKY